MHFDVPINIQDDEGNTILHHILNEHDVAAMKILFTALQPNQRINFNIRNDEGMAIIYEIIKQQKIDGLRDVLNVLKPRQKINFNIKDINGNTIFHYLIKDNHIKTPEFEEILGLIVNNNNLIDFSTFNNAGISMMHIALQMDQKELSLINYAQTENKQIDKETKNIFFQQMQDIVNQENKEEEEQEQDNKQEEEEQEQDNKQEEERSYDQIIDDWELFLNQWSGEIDFILINNRTLVHILMVKLIQLALRSEDRNDYNNNQNVIKEMNYRIAKTYLSTNSDNSDIQNIIEQVIYDMNINIEQETFLDKYNLTDMKDQQFKHNYRPNMFHRKLIQFDATLNQTINTNGMTALGYVLENYFGYAEYFDIVAYLLDNNAKIMVNEISVFMTLFPEAAKKCDSDIYFSYFEKSLKCSNVTTSMVSNSQKNTPIHHLIISQKQNKSINMYLDQLSKLSSRYPEWLTLENVHHHTPLLTAIQKCDFDAFFCLCMHMLNNKTINFRNMISSKMYVEHMVDFGFFLVEKRKSSHLSLLLKCFNYFEIFYYPSNKTHIANFMSYGFKSCNSVSNKEKKEDVLSLIKAVRLTRDATSQNAQNIHELLFNVCGLIKTKHESEFVESRHYFEQKINTEKAHHFTADDNYYENLVDDSKDEKQTDYYQDDDANMISMADDESHEINSHPINYVEIIYSTIVETFSTLDLVTDAIIFIQLYNTSNQWWATWMIGLLLSPYLVSYGSLATLLQQKIFYAKSNKCVSLLILLLLTPLSVLYLFTIDLIFMFYSLFSTLLFVTTLTKIDIKPFLDKYIFHQILRMNRTEIIGYRRLRTLSQLLFETIPQILLQGRMLWVIKINGDDNSFKIDVKTIIVSISLAALHLILEGGIIYLDSQTLKMTFMQYSLISLGGRIQWIPYQHFFTNIVKNQLFMDNIFDDSQSNIENKRSQFDCLRYSVNCIDDTATEQKKEKVFALNYDEIHKDILFFRYEITFQFSNALIKHFSSELLNSPSMIVPKGFKLSTTNNVLQIFFKSILCRAELNLGYESVGNINMFSLCELYQSSIDRLKLNISKFENKTVNKIISNTAADDDTIRRIIMSSLIHYGEVAAFEWPIFHGKSLKYTDKLKIKSNTLNNCLPSANNNFVLDLAKLRNCFKRKCFLAVDCETMKDITNIVNDYANKCKYDGSWCFVVMLLLLYTRGCIFVGGCDNGCCKNLSELLVENCIKYLPKHIKFGEMLIPFKLFESSKLFNYDQIEQILVNMCKNWIILYEENKSNSDQNLMFIEIPTDKYDVNSFQYVSKQRFNYLVNKLENALYNLKVEYEDIGELDEFVYEFKLYTNYNSYLHRTLPYRKLSKFDSAKFGLKSNTANSFKINKLIPQFEKDNQDRLQIFELTIWSDDQKSMLTDNVEQIYFSTNDSNSSLNDRILLYNAIGNIVDDANELTITHNNIGLSFYNHYLLHQSTNAPKLMIETKANCEIAIHVKYSNLYRKDAAIQKPKHQTLTAFLYSTSLFKALHKYNYVNKSVSDHELMNLCVEVAFFISVPNKAKFQIDYKQYMTVLERYFLPTIANIITSYVMHPESYLRWERLSTLPPTERYTKEVYLDYERQLEYTHFDSIVDFRNARVDYLVVPTTILDRNHNYYINVYLFGKGDESAIGIYSAKSYRPKGVSRCQKNSLLYYGGRKWSTKRAGGTKNDQCTSYDGSGRDCNHGSIQGGKEGKVVLHPIEAHGEGDWINFSIDFKNNIFSVYKNGIFQGSVKNEIPDGNVYFTCEPDEDVDKYYVEEAIDDANYIYEDDDNKKDDY